MNQEKGIIGNNMTYKVKMAKKGKTEHDSVKEKKRAENLYWVLFYGMITWIGFGTFLYKMGSVILTLDNSSFIYYIGLIVTISGLIVALFIKFRPMYKICLGICYYCYAGSAWLTIDYIKNVENFSQSQLHNPHSLIYSLVPLIIICLCLGSILTISGINQYIKNKNEEKELESRVSQLSEELEALRESINKETKAP